MRKTFCLVLAFTIALASFTMAYSRPHYHGGGFGGPGPKRSHVVHYSHPSRHSYYYGHHHHYHGPSRGWYNGALVVGATLAGLEILADFAKPAETVIVEKPTYVQPPVQPVVVQQPQPVVIQQPVVVPQPQPVVVTPLPQASAPAQEQWVILPNGSTVKFK